VLIAFLPIGSFLLVTEHREHLVWLVPYWPWLLLLAGPLLHFFCLGDIRASRKQQVGTNGKHGGCIHE
jgi:hypothetical protein